MCGEFKHLSAIGLEQAFTPADPHSCHHFSHASIQASNKLAASTADAKSIDAPFNPSLSTSKPFRPSFRWKKPLALQTSSINSCKSIPQIPLSPLFPLTSTHIIKKRSPSTKRPFRMIRAVQDHVDHLAIAATFYQRALETNALHEKTWFLLACKCKTGMAPSSPSHRFRSPQSPCLEQLASHSPPHPSSQKPVRGGQVGMSTLN